MIPNPAWAVAVLMLVSAPAAHAQSESKPGKPAPMACEAGPIDRMFGGTLWRIYGCTDGVSLVMVSAKGNPAMPFIFIFTPVDGAYRLSGEGNGDKAASQAAGDAISEMTASEISALLAETKAKGR